MIKEPLRLLVSRNLLFWIIMGALVLRLGISALGFHDDLIVNTGWGEWIYEHGPKGFYENTIWIYSWPTQPPLISLLYGFNFYLYEQINTLFVSISWAIATYRLAPTYMIWWFDFVKWFGTQLYGETAFKIGGMISMKILAILADVLVGVVIYLSASKIVRQKYAAYLTSVYLFFPFSWYLSALWGQYDQLSTLLLLLSFLLLSKRYFFFSVLVLLFAGQVKPTSAYFLPLYIVYFFYQRPNFINMVIPLLGALVAFWAMTAPFADRDPFSYTLQVVYQKVFFVERFEGLVNRSFNLWQFLEPSGGRSSFRYLGVPAFLWGYFSLVIFYLWSILVLRKKNDLKSMMISMYIIAGGSYLFGTGMVDRYFFPGAVFLIILTAYYSKLWKLCLVTILLFSFNLFYSWGFPFLDKYGAWQNGLIIRSFSLAQVIVFFLCLKRLKVFEVWMPIKNKIIDLVSRPMARRS